MTGFSRGRVGRPSGRRTRLRPETVSIGSKVKIRKRHGRAADEAAAMRTLRACPMLLHGRHASWSSPGGTRSFGFTGPPKENRRGASFDGDPNRKNGSASAETCFGRRTGRASARTEIQPGRLPASADTLSGRKGTDRLRPIRTFRTGGPPRLRPKAANRTVNGKGFGPGRDPGEPPGLRSSGTPGDPGPASAGKGSPKER